MARPGMGSNFDAPSSSSSASWSSGDRRTATCSPNSARNMLPLTKAALFPNIGRVCTPGASGTRESNQPRLASSGFGIFMLMPERIAAADRAKASGSRSGQADDGTGQRPEHAVDRLDPPDNHLGQL